MPHISSISFRMAEGKERYDINLRGRNLIFTGRNGSGKTTLINSIHSAMLGVAGYDERKIPIEADLDHKKSALNFIREKLSQKKEGDFSTVRPEDVEIFESQIIDCVRSLNNLKSEIFSGTKTDVAFTNPQNFPRTGHFRIADIFKSDRFANIPEATSAYSQNSQNIKLSIGNRQNLGGEIEQHLVNLYVKRSLNITYGEDEGGVNEINSWLEKLSNQIQFLMEDDGAEIVFSHIDFKVYIKRGDGRKISFQTLSSGYSAVFFILFTMLMSAKVNDVSPENLMGVVFIDEIDVHLHVSLQQKIFPFLTQLFPQVQFIVTTHSPFVLASVSDALIFDLDKNQEATDLSLYSYDSIVEGLFSMKAESFILQNKIKELVKMMNGPDLNINGMISIISDLEVVKENLDVESKYFLNKAELIIAKNK